MLELADLRAARDRIASFVHRTPVTTNRAVDGRAGASVFFKCEQLQRGGSFKARGATSAVSTLPERVGRRGLVTHSSGNHGQALALAARDRGWPCWVVAPTTTPRVKLAAMRDYGAQIRFCPPILEERERGAADLVREQGALFIHPYDDDRVIAGQGTVGLEISEQVPEADAVIVPVGGGGLLSGVATALRALRPRIRIYGAEPAGADDAARSLARGTLLVNERVETLADGLRTNLCQRTFEIIAARVDDIVPVGDAETVAAMRFFWERTKSIIEPSAAVALAALLGGHVRPRPRRPVVVLSGGNVDLDALPW